MSPNIVLLVTAGILIAAGIYLMLERSLTRILVGVVMTSNGVNMLFLVASGPAKEAPIIDLVPAGDMSDSLPQAMVLTAIVITLGTAAFMLTVAYRSFQLNGHDEAQDDVEDNRIIRLAEADEASQSYDESEEGAVPDEDDGPDDGGVPGVVQDSEAAREARRVDDEAADDEAADDEVADDEMTDDEMTDEGTGVAKSEAEQEERT
ncbi:Na(+)/H(+) antiporter subunit C [Propionibacteriaceae bacterium Y2011]|uniref:Na(+)/H(+) antiporter subunit C n=1 Tax=Microlunatus sp. Y2014 TaxID=3418488 RepID=UPI003B4E3C8A